MWERLWYVGREGEVMVCREGGRGYGKEGGMERMW